MSIPRTIMKSLWAVIASLLMLAVVGPAQSQPFAYITGQNGSIVSVLDTATNTVVTTIPVGGAPFGVGILPNGSRAYVANSTPNTVSVINLATNTVIATIGVGSGPAGVAVNPAGSRVYVANLISNSVSVIDTSTNGVINTVPLSQAYGLAINPAGTRLFVTNPGINQVSIIDTTTNSVTGSIGLTGGPGSFGVAFNPSGTRAYVANEFGPAELFVIDTSTNTIITSVAVGAGTSGVAVNPAGTRVYTANGSSDTVSVVDTATNTVTNTIAVGSSPRSVTFNASGTRAYVGNVGSNTVSVIDTGTETVIATVPVTQGPFGIAVAPALLPATFTVTPSAGANGAINPATAQTIASGATAAFTITPAPGYTASAGGTCGGTLAGNTYTTNAVTANCTVTASFSAIPIPAGGFTLTSSSNPAIYRSSIVLTASATGNAPTGTVTFNMATNAGPLTLCAAVPLVSARAKCPVPAPLIVNSPSFFSATYGGDANNPGAAAALQQLINPNNVALDVTATPPQPAVGTNVVLRATVASATLTNKVTFNENGTALPGCGAVTIAPLPGATNIGLATCTITGITAGLHNYVVTYLHTADNGFEQVVVPVTPLVTAASDYTDMWWAGLAENGWGVSITQHGRLQFVVLYAYEASGKPVWYVLPSGTWNVANNAYTGALYQPTSSAFNNYRASSFNAGASVGNATLTYTGSGTATLSYTINGVSGSKSIVRQPFASDDGATRLQVNDMWWAGSEENGWGMNIAQQGRMLFPVWYTYDATGRTVFYAVPGGTWSGSSFTGDIYSTSSSAWLGVSYDVAKFSVTKAGTMTLDFGDQNNAVMTYTIGGVTQRKAIVRQGF